jgi:WD repeat-containing protein 35
MRKIGRETAWFIDEQPDISQMYDKDTFDKEKQTEDII